MTSEAHKAHMLTDARSMSCQVCDAFQSYIWEPVLVKESALNAATEAACLILSIDETVKNPQLSALGLRHFETVGLFETIVTIHDYTSYLRHFETDFILVYFSRQQNDASPEIMLSYGVNLSDCKCLHVGATAKAERETSRGAKRERQREGRGRASQG